MVPGALLHSHADDDRCTNQIVMEVWGSFVPPPAKPPNLSSWKRPCAAVVTHRGCYLLSKKVSEVECLSEAGQLPWVAQKWGQKEKQMSQKRHRWISWYTSHRQLGLHTGSNPEVCVEYPEKKIRASPCSVPVAFQPSWMRTVPGGWHGWRIYFSDKAEDEVLTACIYSRADGLFWTERAKDSCPVWTHPTSVSMALCYSWPK